MKVLSLFDGCGMAYQALKNLGINVDKYYASEVDRYAMQIAKKNHPDIIEVGDINNLNSIEEFDDIDLLIAGFPCQSFSIAGKRLNFEDDRGQLFFKALEIWKVTNPRYFLFENVASMRKDIRAEISKLIGVDYIMINSALVSAQNRKRLYWTNISDIKQPEDKKIYIKDILLETVEEKYFLKDVRLKITQQEKVFFNKPIVEKIKTKVSVRKNDVDRYKLKKILRKHKNDTIKNISAKLNLPKTKVEHWFRTDKSFSIPDPEKWFKLKDILEIKTDEFDKAITEFEIKDNVFDTANRCYRINGKSPTLTTGKPFKIIDIDNKRHDKPDRIGDIGSNAQAYRVYSVAGKSVSLNSNGGGQGAKTGLYLTGAK